MIYLIDMRIKYRTEDGAIWLQEDNDSLIILTVTMNRLLSYLLEHRGQVVTRDDLLENIWDLHGLRSSSHTLNKYISEIRKLFKKFGIDKECITTIPRIGFMFSSDVDVQTAAEEQQVTKSIAEVESRHVISKNKSASSSSMPWLAYTVMAFGILTFCIFLLPDGLWSKGNVTVQKTDMPTFFLFNFETCPVYTTQNNSLALTERKKALFMELAAKDKITCLHGTSFLYQVSDPYLYGRKGRTFISRCTSKDGKYISCLNFFGSGYESKIG